MYSKNKTSVAGGNPRGQDEEENEHVRFGFEKYCGGRTHGNLRCAHAVYGS